jgi:S-(hydroxymethyl)glutathione dehydrogenase / alcohol dehydrogenase
MLRAAICHDFGQPLVIEPVKLARPGPEDVLLDVKACAICHSDISFARGEWDCPLPAVFGHEAAGIVLETGNAVTKFKRGDRAIITLIRSCGSCHYCSGGSPVMCDNRFDLDRNGPLTTAGGDRLFQGLRTGAFASQVVVHQSQLVSLPGDIPFDIASLLACGVITGYGAVFNTARLQTGQSAVIIGCGGVGLNTIQSAALAGARPIVAIDLAENKRRAAQEFGATDMVDPITTNAAKAVMQITGGYGADYVFVTVGNNRAIESASAMIGKKGAIVIVGMPPTGVSVSYDPGTLAAFNQRILGSKMGETVLERDIPAIIEAWRNRKFKLEQLITGRYRLEQINEAIASVLNGDALRNVILFD